MCVRLEVERGTVDADAWGRGERRLAGLVRVESPSLGGGVEDGGVDVEGAVL